MLAERFINPAILLLHGQKRRRSNSVLPGIGGTREGRGRALDRTLRPVQGVSI